MIKPSSQTDEILTATELEEVQEETPKAPPKLQTIRKSPVSALSDMQGPPFHIYETNPKKMVELLESYYGDVAQYVQHFFHLPAIEVLSKTMAALNYKDNIGYKQKWNFLTESFEQAKVALAKRKHLDFIAKYEPSEDKLDLSKFTSYSRFWLASHSAADVTRAKREANFAPAPGEADELAETIIELNDEIEE